MNTALLDSMDGKEVSPGIYIVGEPTPVVGTDRLRSLANVHGCLCVVELKLRFEPQTKEPTNDNN